MSTYIYIYIYIHLYKVHICKHIYNAAKYINLSKQKEREIIH